mmetsp:Transcript_54071/g.157870  ORF Transcript_54071/g.157870 Transcript_54071/m.157870 type:complete len:271 (+) Transcript_54071:335-1147(+)
MLLQSQVPPARRVTSSTTSSDVSTSALCARSCSSVQIRPSTPQPSSQLCPAPPSYQPSAGSGSGSPAASSTASARRAAALAPLAASWPMAQASTRQPGISASARPAGLLWSAAWQASMASGSGGLLAQTTVALSSRDDSLSSSSVKEPWSNRRFLAGTCLPQVLAMYPYSSSAKFPSALPHCPSCPGCLRIVMYALTLTPAPLFHVSRTSSSFTPAGRFTNIVSKLRPFISICTDASVLSIFIELRRIETTSPSQVTLPMPSYSCSITRR